MKVSMVYISTIAFTIFEFLSIKSSYFIGSSSSFYPNYLMKILNLFKNVFFIVCLIYYLICSFYTDLGSFNDDILVFSSTNPLIILLIEGSF